MRAFLTLLLVLSLNGLLRAQDNFEVTEAGILEIQEALQSGELTSVELTRKYLDRIAAYDRQGPRLNSLVRINPEALAIAEALDEERRSSGPRGPLHGIPVIIKDNYNTTDLPTTASSVALAGFTPSASATQVDLLVAAGAIVIGKSNLHEFAYGITSIGSLAGQTRNPYDPRRVPGGSSGGTGAAIAASFAAVGMGSDTCGSIRIPSAFNNLVGLRPSKGLSSIYGIIPLSHTQDVAGPLARSVSDLAIVLDTVSGYDPLDEATAIMANLPPPGFVRNLESESLDGLRLGRLTDYFERADSGVTAVIDDALEELTAAGAEVIDLEIPEMAGLIASSGLIGFEFKDDLDQYLNTFGNDGVATLSDIVEQGLYHEAIQGVMTRSASREFDEQGYLDAVAARTVLRTLIEETMVDQQLDALIYPTIGEFQVYTGEAQAGSNCSVSANSGLPAISIPVGIAGNGLPVGLELMGAFLADTRLVSIAWQAENLLQTRQTPLATPPLIDRQAPAPWQADLEFQNNDVTLAGSFTYDQTTRELAFSVTNRGADGGNLLALVLFVDEAPVGELNDPVVANLLPPDGSTNSDSLFVTAALHRAIVEGRTYIRVFAAGAPPTGMVQPLGFFR